MVELSPKQHRCGLLDVMFAYVGDNVNGPFSASQNIWLTWLLCVRLCCCCTWVVFERPKGFTELGPFFPANIYTLGAYITARGLGGPDGCGAVNARQTTEAVPPLREAETPRSTLPEVWWMHHERPLLGLHDGGGRRRRAGRITTRENKNPAQRCREKKSRSIPQEEATRRHTCTNRGIPRSCHEFCVCQVLERRNDF